MAERTPESVSVEDKLTSAWQDKSNRQYEQSLQMSQQALDISNAIAAGAPATLEQFVYASLGGHPDWTELYERISAVNEQLDPSLPLALFSRGALRYFGYPAKSGDWLEGGMAFDYTFETSMQENERLSNLLSFKTRLPESTETTHFSSTLSLPMRSLYDLEPRNGLRRGMTEQVDTSLNNMFRSSVSTQYFAPYPRPHYNFHMTTAEDEEPGEKLVIASGMRDIVMLVSKSLTDENLDRLRFAMKHEKDDPEAGAD